ncbi:MAG TPA: heterodisulfide reductase-related iron-sulfur binding cluster [Syntrophorhabdaceae bacterium]|nr:heterodisulfide reductase-related iron-sulfur binding cluster [Syntrophorhabdaceae bacterium]
MEYGYYPGCSLTGSAKRLDRGVRQICTKLGHTLREIPDWNCCGALEYGDRQELMSISGENLTKAQDVYKEIVVPCPACYKNLKDADSNKAFTILSPLELLDKENLSRIEQKADLKGETFFPYYGCLLMRPEASAIRNKNIMEEIITAFGGDIDGEKMKDRCCGGNQLFLNKWATEKLSKLILNKTKGTVVVFCPFCHMAMKTFAEGRKVVYLTDLLLYVMGERKSL